MSVLKALISVMTMQLATTLKGVIPALARLATQAMDFHALVIKFVYFLIISDVGRQPHILCTTFRY